VRAAFVLISLMAFSLTARAETRDSVVEMCGNRDMMVGYLTGIMFQKVSDASKLSSILGPTHDAARSKEHTKILKAMLGQYCVPDGQRGPKMIDALCSYAKAHPPNDGVYGVDRVQKIFETLYPCAQ